MDKRVSLGERVSQCAEVHRTPFQYTRSENGILILGSTEGVLGRYSHWPLGGRREGRNRRGDVNRRGVLKVQGPKEDEEIEKSELEGDQAYAPFGAGRETGHQVPVVAAKIESDR
jgi:hypothetical protein